MLFEKFGPAGPVQSIRVCRDAVTRRSLGYAYINFHQEKDAERALDTLNYDLLKGRPVRIMWSQRDPSLRRSGLGNIFIKNLDKSIDNKDLHDTFSAFGDILSCKVVTDPTGSSRGYGYVHYESEESANTAIEKVNGMLLNNKKVYVGRHIPKRERDNKTAEARKNFTNIFVKNLDESVTDEEISSMFSKYGEIASAVVMKNKDGKSKGFGFVNFKSHEAAEKACTAGAEELKEKKIYIGRAQKKHERQEELAKKFEAFKQERLNKYQGVNLYVKNLDDSLDDDTLRTRFAEFGTITSAKIARDDKGNSKGFGFVCYSSPEEATKAVTSLNTVMVGTKPIFVALAERKEVRRQKLEQQYQQRASTRQLQQSSMAMGGMFPPGAAVYYQNPGVRPQMGYYQQPPPMRQPMPRWQPGQPRMPGMGPTYPQDPSFNQRMPPRGQRPNQPNNPRGQPQQGNPNAQPRNPQGGPRNPNAPNQNQRGGYPNKQQRDAPEPQALTAAALANLSPEQAKQMIGEAIYMQVAMREPDLAGKITGMLLEMDNAELLSMLETRASLDSKVDEALAVLRAHNMSTPADKKDEDKRRSLDRVSVPVWLVILSDQLGIVA